MVRSGRAHLSEDRTTFRKVNVVHFLWGSAKDFVDLRRIRGISARISRGSGVSQLRSQEGRGGGIVI